MFGSGNIRLFWWSEIYLQHKDRENYGDLIGKYLVEKISGKKVVWAHPKKFSIKNFWQPIYVTAGSILPHANKHCIVWGSGIISKEYTTKKAKFLAVRGPQTHTHLLQQGHDVPATFGDPALLLPNFYHPKVEKQYEVGIIPHYNDHKEVRKMFHGVEGVAVIDLMTNDIEKTTRDILQCKKMVSSSLHGLIVSHAYGIPALWVKFSDKIFGDGIKYHDYYESVRLKDPKPVEIDQAHDLASLQLFFENNTTILPAKDVIVNLQESLMRSCPFRS